MEKAYGKHADHKCRGPTIVFPQIIVSTISENPRTLRAEIKSLRKNLTAARLLQFAKPSLMIVHTKFDCSARKLISYFMRICNF